MFRFAFGLPLLMSVIFCGPAAAAGKDDAQIAFFESKIRPVLVASCYECHSAEAKESKGGLVLDTREGIRRGGESGHAVVPGDMDESLILDAIKYESFEMPPDGQLPARVIRDFERWVKMGAPDPRDGKSAPIRSEIDFERAREFWSFRKVDAPEVPIVKNSRWLRSDIDAFIAAKLESKGIQPVADAEGTDLVRRIYFDLIGLPPTPGQVDQFLVDYANDADSAIAMLVDELLSSRHFGERWGRHWMDVVRFAESTGMERNGTFPHAWRYRDWVIDAFNQDKPYDDFVREQIAGDLLEYDSLDERHANFVATGLLAIGPKSLNETDKEKFALDVADEQIDVVSRAFLGLTASCARCHDHKFDPIPQSEYYSLAGIFTSSETLYGVGKTNGNRNPGRVLAISGDKARPVAASGASNNAKLKKTYESKLKSENKKLAAYEKQLERAKNEKAKQVASRKIRETNEEIRKWTNRIKQVSAPEQKIGDDTTLVMAMIDASDAEDEKLRIRGEPDEYGGTIPRGFLTIVTLGEPPAIPDDGSGRLELANWIVGFDNPLTARVAVNRVWQHLFGRGIVATVNNFGANGDRPTHPDLLDHLASEFMADGGSIKQLIRRIMTSRVYRLSTESSVAGNAADPDNEWLWRANQRRLEAEAIRDAMLASAGNIDLSPGQASIVAKVGEGLVGQTLKAEQLHESGVKRSVYLPIVRGELPAILRIFDFPEPSIIGGVRDVTTVPTQALYMMNDEFVMQTAATFAQRLLDEASIDDHARVRLAYRLSVGRKPTHNEIKQAIRYIDEMQSILEAQKTKKSESESQLQAWSSFCQTLFASSEFRYIN
tara:strand:+ start:57870 stop:60365 length:2496 start_codon:yes stop_codon:yes gene_type:complete